jgi:hypothetical protein
MGSMSTSGAAPLPRLGEVFFDVRSTSRCLRISWYADTGVAVLSIWQGETCTGSFRLPMGDLPRLIETLQRGPDGPAGPGHGGRPRADEPGPDAVPASPGRYPADSGSLRYLNGYPPADYPHQETAGYQERPAPPGYGGELPPGNAAARGTPDYPGHASPAGHSRPVSYPEPADQLQQPTLPPYPDQAQAHHPDQPVPPQHQGQPVPARYRGRATPPARPDRQIPPHNLEQPRPADHLEQSAGAHYPDRRARPPYPDSPGPADDQGRAGHRDMPSESPGVRYPDGSGPHDYSPAQPGYESHQVAAAPYGHEPPGWAGQQAVADRDTGHVSLADDLLEPLPESFPYRQPRPDHELGDRPPERLGPFA